MTTGFTRTDDVTERLAGWREQIEGRLASLLSCQSDRSGIAAAMHAAVLPGGKRLRPLLVVTAGEALGAPSAALVDLACALEMVHCASLVLDDMPAMDNALVRRGQPTVHVRFGEDVALLATIGLVSEACRIAAAAPGLRAPLRARSVQVLCEAIGPLGLVRGQYRDLREDNPGRSVAAVAEANDEKTGVLFATALELAARAAGAAGDVPALRRAGFALGQAFQLRDDLEDSVPSADGTAAPDAGKATLVRLIGPAAVRDTIGLQLHSAATALQPVLARDPHVLTGLLRGSFPEAWPETAPPARVSRSPRWRGASWVARAA